MKKSILLLIFIGLFVTNTNAQEEVVDIKKGDYNILKFDALNMMGIGVQKLHFGYEISPMRQNESNLPTIQFNLIAPFNSLNEDLEIDFGLEAGIEIRFYQHRSNKKQLLAEGFYFGAGLDGGMTKFELNDEYTLHNQGNTKIKEFTEYERVRTGIHFLLGGQSKLGEKLYFDVNMGLGWSNVNVKESNPVTLASRTKEGVDLNPFLHLYNEGKSQRVYIPISFGLGYNFGSK
ncbi:MAG: hypothetical protein COA58_09280 [Bacteroidetes bacterium]|nr:MAG: hypothetical protein COA58_09280 [Bacteroidota bacterium]